jgi:hypothetical protein
LHIERQRPCGQALHTLQWERYFTPCSHGPFVGGARLRFTPFFVSNSGASTSPSASSMFGTSILTIGRRTVVITPARPTKCQRSHSFQISYSFLNRRKTNLQKLIFSLTVNSTETLRLPVMGQGCSLVSIQLSTTGQSDDDFWLNFG